MPSLSDMLVLGLCLCSAVAWVGTLWRWRLSLSSNRNLGSLETSEASPQELAEAGIRRPRPIPAGAMLLAGLWILQSLMQVFAAASAPGEVAFDPDRVLDGMRQSLLLQGAIAAALWLSLRWTPGESSHDRRRGAIIGGLGQGLLCVTKAWLPVFLVLVASQSLREADDTHTVLRLLSERPSSEIYLWSILSAVVMAPVFEELVFRVILQDWLRRMTGRWGAILFTAVMFAAVHRFPDSLALVPLALLLGWTYDRFGSYVSVVTAHATFNAVMLVLHAISATVTSG